MLVRKSIEMDTSVYFSNPICS